MHKDFPEGLEFFDQLEDKLFNKCVIETRKLIEKDLNLKAKIETLGTLLSYLSRLSECYWGCIRQDHIIEYLLGKACNSVSASVILMKRGHYDSSMATLRDTAEISNLFMLFGAHPEELISWQTCKEKDRRRKFSPVGVRKALEEKGTPTPINQTIYHQFSERFVHVSPKTRTEYYSHTEGPLASGIFQKNGVKEVMKFQSHFVSQLALASILVLKPRKEVSFFVIDQAEKLKGLVQ